MGSFAETYKKIIRTETTGNPVKENTLDYWQDRLFFNSVAIILPLSLIAIVPGIYYSLTIQAYHIAIMDMVVLLSILLIAFSGKWISVWIRKSLFVGVLLAVAFFLVDFIGPHGPGLLYMLVAVIFALLIFSAKYAFYWSYLVTALCLVLGAMIRFEVATNEDLNSISVAEWFAICVNVIFLCFLFSALIPYLKNGLDNSLKKQEELKQELLSKNQDLEHFTYYVSHDLQQPLRTVAGFVKLLDNKYADKMDEKGTGYLQHIRNGTEHMQGMIRELLDFSRAGSYSGAHEHLELKDILGRVEKIHQQGIEEKGARISLHSNINLVVNRTAMVEVLQNLVENAMKYTKPGEKPEIIIEGREWKDHWEISVRDNGIGIDPSYFERIFIVFERLHHNAAYPGMGIGLALVKKIINKMGGEVKVESVPDKGSTFSFTIPRKQL